MAVLIMLIVLGLKSSKFLRINFYRSLCYGLLFSFLLTFNKSFIYHLLINKKVTRMVRKYKFIVKPELGPDVVLVLECNLVSHLEKPSEVFDGRISFLKDRSIRIWDYYPEINSDDSSSDWQNFFQIITLTPVGQVKPIYDYEVFVVRSETKWVLLPYRSSGYSDSFSFFVDFMKFNIIFFFVNKYEN